MAYGKIKADAIIRDNSGSDEEITLASLAAKAGTASPTFTGTVNLPATTNFANASTLEILDNNANAFQVDEGTNNYVNFNTTNGSEEIEVRKKVQLDEDLEFSAAKDILILDNSSAALEIKEGTTSYLTFDTTNSAEQIEVAKAVVASDNITLNAQKELRLADSDSSNYVAIKSPATVASNVTLTLPADDGDADQVLSTNGSGVLDWVEAASGKLLKVTTLTNNTRTSVSTASYSRQPVAMLAMGNVTKTSSTSTLIAWGHSSGHGQSSGGGDFYIKINTGVIDRAGSFTYPGGNYANHITWAGKYPYSLNAGTYAVELGHHSQSNGNRPLNVINPNSGDHGNFSSSGNNGTGTTIFIMEFEA